VINLRLPSSLICRSLWDCRAPFVWYVTMDCFLGLPRGSSSLITTSAISHSVFLWCEVNKLWGAFKSRSGRWLTFLYDNPHIWVYRAEIYSQSSLSVWSGDRPHNFNMILVRKNRRQNKFTYIEFRTSHSSRWIIVILESRSLWQLGSTVNISCWQRKGVLSIFSGRECSDGFASQRFQLLTNGKGRTT